MTKSDQIVSRNKHRSEEGELTPEQQELLGKWRKNAGKAPEIFTKKEQEDWGFTKDTRAEQAEVDEQKNPSKQAQNPTWFAGEFELI